METVTDSQELVVWAEKGALAEAKATFSRFDASFRTIPSASSRKNIPTSKVSLFYLRDAEPNAEIEHILKSFKGHKTSFVVLYTPHQSSDFAFRMGKIVGKHSLDSADWAFNLRHVEQLLRARNVIAHRAHSTAERFDIVAARKRLGLTQEQMANALNVTTRTLQNGRVNLLLRRRVLLRVSLWKAPELICLQCSCISGVINTASKWAATRTCARDAPGVTIAGVSPQFLS